MITSAIDTIQIAKATNDASSRLTENFDTFLNLLTTQLKNQDPLEPMKSSEFVNQLVQFSQVEQAINANKNLEKILVAQAANQAAASLSYIGKTVEAKGNTVPLKDGNAEFTYALAEKAESTLIIITNDKGDLVFSAQGNTAAGKHGFVWDGLDKDGNQAPDGAYKITVAARTDDDDIIDITINVVAQITGIETTDDGLFLVSGDVKLPFADVVSVRETPST